MIVKKRKAKKTSEAMLPTTRGELFLLAYRTNFSVIVKLSLLTSVFALPLFVSMIVIGLLSGAPQVSEETAQEVYRAYLTSRIYLDLLYIPSIVILFVGFAGGFTLMKRYVMSDGFTFAKTFFGGIKQNGGEFAAHGAIFGAVFYLANFARNYASIYSMALYVPMTVAAIVIIAVAIDCALFSATAVPIYKNKFARTLKNSFLFAFNGLLSATGIVIITFLPMFAVGFFGSPIASMIVFALYMIVGFGNAVLVCTLYCHSRFDKFVNEKNFPEIYRKGLYEPQNAENYSDTVSPTPLVPRAYTGEDPDYLRVENLTFSYDGKTRVLDGVSFSAARDDMLCVIGESGAGKTTLLKLMAGLLYEDDGDVFVASESQKKHMSSDRKIGFTFQSPNLYTHLTVYQNLAMAFVDKVSADEKDERIKQMLESFGLSRYINLKPKYLSEGERQRVALAKALICDKDFYLFDEPVSAMDVRGRRRVLETTAAILRERGRPAVYVSHDSDAIFGVATKILALCGGKVVCHTTVENAAMRPPTADIMRMLSPDAVFVGGAIRGGKLVIGGAEIADAAGLTDMSVRVGIWRGGLRCAQNGAIEAEFAYSGASDGGATVIATVDGEEVTADACGMTYRDGDAVRLEISGRAVVFDANGESLFTTEII